MCSEEGFNIISEEIIKTAIFGKRTQNIQNGGCCTYCAKSIPQFNPIRNVCKKFFGTQHEGNWF
jgi:hypothetical protein